MTLTGLVLLVLLTCGDAIKSWDPDCIDCNENGQWWPLFRPSQIIKSEFPEHRRQFVVDEGSSSYEHGSNFNEKYRLDWEHRGDLNRVSTVPNGSLESYEREPEPRLPPRSAERVQAGERVVGEKVTSSENVRGGNKLRDIGRVPSGETSREGVASLRPSESSEDLSIKSEEGSLSHFYEGGSFTPTKDRFSEDFDISKDFSFSNEESSNSIEFPSFLEGRQKNKVATSYAAFSSVFAKPKPVSPRSRDLLHPVQRSNIVPNYSTGFIQGRTPVSHFKFFNGLNVTGQYLIHKQEDRKDLGFGLLNSNNYDHQGLWVNRGKSTAKPISRSSQLLPTHTLKKQVGPFVPKDHPVYRYVKNHAGQTNEPLSRRNQDFHEDHLGNVLLQSNAPVKIQIQKHESVVRHVIPTKSPFSEKFWKDKDSFWKESRRVETYEPPPLSPSTAHSFLIIKKKTNNLNLRRIGRRNPHYVYILRSNNKIS